MFEVLFSIFVVFMDYLNIYEGVVWIKLIVVYDVLFFLKVMYYWFNDD